MTLDDYNSFCACLPGAAHVVQWGGAHVWKVGGKVFAIAWGNGDGDGGAPSVTFKCTRMSFDLLRERPGVRPAPYLAARGMTWLQRTDASSMDDAALCDYLRASHRLVAAGLTRRQRQELGLV